MVCFSLQQLCSPQNVNCRDLEGRHSTPLHFAAGYNRVSVVEYLLHHGADVHAKDKGYGTLWLRGRWSGFLLFQPSCLMPSTCCTSFFSCVTVPQRYFLYAAVLLANRSLFWINCYHVSPYPVNHYFQMMYLDQDQLFGTAIIMSLLMMVEEQGRPNLFLYCSSAQPPRCWEAMDKELLQTVSGMCLMFDILVLESLECGVNGI